MPPRTPNAQSDDLLRDRGTRPDYRATTSGDGIVGAGAIADNRKYPAPRERTWGEALSGETKGLAIAVARLLGSSERKAPAQLFQHYVESTGQPYQLKDIPQTWQDWIVKQTRGRPGVYRNLDPYEKGMYDLQNALGHFDVKVARAKDGSTSYLIHDYYEFPPPRSQRERHGFGVNDISGWEEKTLKALLPSKEYRTRNGFVEHWEIRQAGKEKVLFIPQRFLEDAGKPFEVSGSFTRAGH